MNIEDKSKFGVLRKCCKCGELRTGCTIVDVEIFDTVLGWLQVQGFVCYACRQDVGPAFEHKTFLNDFKEGRCKCGFPTAAGERECEYCQRLRQNIEGIDKDE
jgi:hypothetical protein